MNDCRVIDFAEAKRRLRPEARRIDAFQASIEQLADAYAKVAEAGMRLGLGMLGIHVD